MFENIGEFERAKKKVMNIIKSKIGLEPNDLYYDGKEFIAYYYRPKVELRIGGTVSVNKKEIKVNRILINTAEEYQILQYYIYQIFQIFKE